MERASIERFSKVTGNPQRPCPRAKDILAEPTEELDESRLAAVSQYSRDFITSLDRIITNDENITTTDRWRSGSKTMDGNAHVAFHKSNGHSDTDDVVSNRLLRDPLRSAQPRMRGHPRWSDPLLGSRHAGRGPSQGGALETCETPSKTGAASNDRAHPMAARHARSSSKRST